MKSKTENITISVEQATKRLEQLCAKAEHCTSELYEKLRKWGISASDSAKIMERLQENRFVDDFRFTQAFVNDKIRFSRWGQRKILAALYAKHIDTEIIREVLGSIEKDEIESNLNTLISAKMRTMKEENPRERKMKLLRFGISRGYSYDDVVAAIRRCLSHESED